MQSKSWAVVLVLMVAIIGGLGGFKYLEITSAIAAAQSMPEPSETVQAVRPRVGSWSASARTVGTVMSTRRVELRNELPGTVIEVGFNSGDTVAEGQILVRLDTREEAAELAAARADAELARLTWERRQSLMSTQAGSIAERDAARAQLASTKARVAALEARIAKKTLVAPFAAHVGLRDIQPGTFLSEGTLIATLEGVAADSYVDFSYPQDIAIALAPGSKVTVSSKGMTGGSQLATIIARDARVDDANRSVKFRAVLSGLSSRVAPGSFVDVTSSTAEPRPAVFVPLTAVRRAPFGDHVFILSQDKEVLRAYQRFIRLGPTEGEEAVVLDGLAPDQLIAGMGSFKLREGLAVNIGVPKSAGAPAAAQ